MILSTTFNSFFNGKRVLITGHSGFKGSWLTLWLLQLGAKVFGYSNNLVSNPSHYDLLQIEGLIQNQISDIRDLNSLKNYINDIQPDIVFHLAAQSIVSKSYNNPLETITTNVCGTANVLESLRTLNNNCVAIIITSDKCYQNVEWIWGYREIDRLGGNDLYSSSKASAELIINSYIKSFFTPIKNITICIARAGNVIGGGDWAKDRIIPDIYRSWSKGEPVEIRSPSSTRPWQHVLEPLSGYLTLAQKMSFNNELHSEAFNFGPNQDVDQTVLQLLKDLSRYWKNENICEKYKMTGEVKFNEAKLLKLNCDKAYSKINWKANLNYTETVQFVGEWYANYYQNNPDIREISVRQIRKYEKIAKLNNIEWANA